MMYLDRSPIQVAIRRDVGCGMWDVGRACVVSERLHLLHRGRHGFLIRGRGVRVVGRVRLRVHLDVGLGVDDIGLWFRVQGLGVVC